VGADALLHLTGTSATIYAPPRMLGIELRYRFGVEGESRRNSGRAAALRV
jgi:hypothetical protein